VVESLGRMGLPADDAFLRRYPEEVSVGQAQRVMVAMAVMHRPRLLIADEPTRALDPVSQQDALELFRWLRREFGMALLYISHDLPSVAALADTVAVIEAGRIVERGAVQSVFEAPRHASTRRLLGPAHFPVQ
jgi:ABC-type dipeptide/oligopeptide/nickel transport system ATPase component